MVGITIFTTAIINGLTPAGDLWKFAQGFLTQCLDKRCSRDPKKTSKVIQDDYEKVYTGRLIEYDNRLSQLISMIWVIMMFSAAIPMLYLAGVIICFVMYWADKALFMRVYKLPPKHGADLANSARNIIEWSLVLHLFMGFYMISNPDIFTSEEDENEAVGFF